ncbi:unnamed protein product, partial [marine sediment metagenome]
GSGAPRQITKSGDTYKYQVYWSPDSRKILWGDKLLRLNSVDIETKKIVEVARAKSWEIRRYAWSPDSNWISYQKPEAESMTKIYLYNCTTKKTYEVTEGWYSSDSPSFSSDGKYLFFVSDRDFRPIYSRTEWNHAYLSMARVYLVTLSKDVKSPFEPKSDEVTLNEESEKSRKSEKGEEKDRKKGDKEKTSAQKKKAKIKVDPSGLKDRIISLPIGVANYRHITSVGEKIYYMMRSDRD